MRLDISGAKSPNSNLNLFFLFYGILSTILPLPTPSIAKNWPLPHLVPRTTCQDSSSFS